MLTNRYFAVFLLALSATALMFGGSTIAYVVAKANLWGISSKQYAAEQENKPIFVSVKALNKDDSYTDLEDTTAIITNPTNKHVATCVKGSIFSLSNPTQSVYSTIFCFSDIAPYTTTTKSIPIHDFHKNIPNMCYEQDAYKASYARYEERLSQWEATVQDYRTKAGQNPIYLQALEILSNRKPTPPEKVFSWKFCGFQLVDAF